LSYRRKLKIIIELIL